MTDYSILNWSTTADDNATADGAINWAEFQNPDTVNDSARKVMARVAERIADLAPKRASTGAANTYAVTLTSTPAALTDGLEVAFVAHQDNSGASTLAVNSLGAKPLRSISGTALRNKEVLSGQMIVAKYKLSTDEFLIVNGSPQLYALYSSLLTANVFGLKVGDVKLSMSSSPDAGFIRLKETAQTLNKADYPDLNSWASAQGYPWGSATSTFNIPPAGGYFLRFGASDTSVDPGGTRTPGTAQTASVAPHTHTFTASGTGSHTHTVKYVANRSVGSPLDGGSASILLADTSTGSTGNYTIPASTLTVTGTTDSTGSAETRPANVTMYADMLANPALVAAGIVGVTGYAFKYSTGTSGDPGSGYFGFDTTTLGSIATIRISKTSSTGASLGTILAALSSGTGFYFTKVGAVSQFVYCKLNSSWTDNTTYLSASVSNVSAPGTWSNTDDISLAVTGSSGPAGTAATITVGTVTTGAAGSSASVSNSGTTTAAVFDFSIPRGATGLAGQGAGFNYTFETSTTMGLPADGALRFNNATLASVTAIAINVKTADSGNPSIAGTISTWDDSTTTAHRGRLLIKKTTAPQNFVEFDITGANTDNTTWQQLTVARVADGGSFSASDAISVEWHRTGDAGSGSISGATNNGVAIATGSTALTSTAALTDGQLVVGQTGSAPLPKTVSGDATLSAAGALTVTKTNGTSFATSATTDTTNASNISSGTLSSARLPSTVAYSSANFTADNRLVRTDRPTTDNTNVQQSGITIDDSNNVSGVGTLASGAQTITSASSTALAVGASGTTNPVLQVDSATALVATGIKITGAAAASRVAFAAISSGTDEGLSIDAKGAGTIRLGATSTGQIEFSRNAVPTSNDGAALGTTTLMWSDLFLASGAVINWNNGAVTLTQSGGILTWAGASTFTIGTGTTFTTGTIELGAASDTTLSRASAGVLAVEGATVATLSTAQSWTKHQGVTVGTLTDGATISWDVSTAQKAKVTLGGNRTMNAVTNAVDGYTYTLEIFQDATGSRLISTWTTTGSGSFDFGTAGAPTLTTTASKADILCFEAVTIGGTLKLRYLGAALGFA